MSKFKKFLLPLFLCLVLVMSMALTACGETTDEPTDDDTPPVTEPGGDQTGGDQTGGDQTGGDQTGGDQTGGDQTGGDQTGGDQTGGDQTGGDQTGGDQTGGDQTGGDQPGGNQPGGETPSTPSEPVFTLPTIDTSDWNTIGLKLTNMQVSVESVDYPTNSGAVSATLMEAYVTVDENGNLQGYGAATLNMKNTWVDNTLDAKVYIEDGVIYIAAEGDTLDTSSNEPFAFYGRVDLAEVPDLVEAEGAILTAQQMAETLLPKIESWVNNTLAPVFANTNVTVDEDAIEAFVTELVNSFFVVTENGDGTKTVTFSLDVVKEWNATLSTTTIAGLIDLVAGEGTFASIKTAVTNGTVYAYSVADLINYIENDIGVDIEELIDAVEALLPVIMNAMSGSTIETMTIEEFINGMYGLSGDAAMSNGTIKGYLSNADFLALDVEYAILMIEYDGQIPTDDPDTTDVDESAVIAEDLAAIKEDIAAMVGMLETMTVYDVVMSMQGNVSGGVTDTEMKEPAATPLADEDEPSKAEQMADMIDAMIDMVGSYFTMTMTVDANGVVTDLVISVNASVQGTEIDMTVTVADGKVVVDMEEAVSSIYQSTNVDATVEIVPGYTVTADADKLAAIKAELAKVPAIDATFAQTLFTAYANQYADTKFVYDEANGVYYIVNIRKYGSTGETDGAGNEYYEVYGEVYKITDLATFSFSVSPGCSNLIFVQPTFNATEYDFTASVAVAEGTNVSYDSFTFEVSALQSYENQASYVQDTSRSVNFLYNTVNKTVSCENVWNYGHTWVETAETPDSCTDVYKISYKCSVCNASYERFTTRGHSIGMNTYELIDETAGPLGGYSVVQSCVSEGCTYSRVVATVAINSELAVTESDAVTDNGIRIAVTPTVSGTYELSYEGGVEANGSRYGNVNFSVYQVVTKTDGEGKTTTTTMKMYSYYSQISMPMEAGVTYIIVIHPATYSGNPFLAYNVTIAKVEEQLEEVEA